MQRRDRIGLRRVLRPHAFLAGFFAVARFSAMGFSGLGHGYQSIRFAPTNTLTPVRPTNEVIIEHDAPTSKARDCHPTKEMDSWSPRGRTGFQRQCDPKTNGPSAQIGRISITMGHAQSMKISAP